MNCFNNNKPKLTSSDRTRNINARTLYKSNVRAFQQQATRDRCRNYNGKVGFYTNGMLRNTRTFNMKHKLQKGFALCVDGAFTKKCSNQPNLEKNHQIGVNLQRGLFACKQNKTLSYQPVKLSMGRDSIYNQFLGTSLDSSLACDPLSGFRSIESWPLDFQAKQDGLPPWSNEFGKVPREQWNENEPKITTTDPSGTGLVGLGQVIIDPDNNLFGTDWCSSRAAANEGPLKFLQFTRATAYSIVQGQVFDPTGKDYTGTGGFCCDYSWYNGLTVGSTGGYLPGCGPTGQVRNTYGQAMGCDFPQTCDCSGNIIRLPQAGDLAISGLNSLLDINSNMAQAENFSEEYFLNAWALGKRFPDGNPDWYGGTGDAFGLYELARSRVRVDGPEPSKTEIKNSLAKFVRSYRSFLITQAWAFKWFTGVGIVESVCCIDKENSIFRIIIKTFWGDMFPPELLPAREVLAFQERDSTSNITINGASWRNQKGAPSGITIQVGGIHERGTPSDLSRMAKNIAIFPESSLPAPSNSIGALMNNYSGICGVALIDSDQPEKQGPVGQESASTGGGFAKVKDMADVDFVAPWTLPYYSYETNTGQSFLPPSNPLWTNLVHERDMPGWTPWLSGIPPSSQINTYKIPSTWNNETDRGKPIIMWILNLELFAGEKPGHPSNPGVLKWGGGIGFIASNQLNAFFSKLLGTGFAPLAIMGWQNRGNLRWGSVGDGSGNDCGGEPSMARNAMLLANNGTAHDLSLPVGTFASSLRHQPSTAGGGPYGVYVLKDLYPEPYTIQRSSGECGVRNLAFGNKTQQNYIVSYDKRGGNVNFAVNQKLYTNFAYKQT